MTSLTDRQPPVKTGARVGSAYVAAFLVLATGNAVFAGNLLQSLHPFTFLFWSFLTTAAVFLIRLRIVHGSIALPLNRSSLKAVLILNATSTLNWLGYFYALRFVEPAVVSSIMGGVGPLSTIALERLLRQRRLSARCYIAGAGIVMGTCLLSWACLTGLSGLRATSVADTTIGLIAAVAGGASMAMTTLATKQLGEHGWTASHILAHRFYLLIVVAATLSLIGPGLSSGDLAQTGGLALSTLLGVIVPLWVLQRGILLSEPFTVAALLSLAPILTFSLQGFDDRIGWSVPSAVGCTVVVVFAIYSLRGDYEPAQR